MDHKKGELWLPPSGHVDPGEDPKEAVRREAKEELGSMPGLSVKPVIDMIGVIKDPEKVIPQLESLGFKYKDEYNIPMRLYFNRSEGIDTNLHVYQEAHREIELNLLESIAFQTT